MANQGNMTGYKDNGTSMSKFTAQKYAPKEITLGASTQPLSRSDRRLLAKNSPKFQLVNGRVCKITKH